MGYNEFKVIVPLPTKKMHTHSICHLFRYLYSSLKGKKIMLNRKAPDTMIALFDQSLMLQQTEFTDHDTIKNI